MSDSSLVVRAALEAVRACDRLAPQLADLAVRHEQAASIARPDWAGPHRDTFEARVAVVNGVLVQGELSILRLRGELLAVIAAALAIR